MSSDGRRRMAVIGVSSLLLVAMVVAVTIGISQNKETGNTNRTDISASKKAISSMCQVTDYQQTCVKSLSEAAGYTTDPKELILLTFNVATQEIKKAVEKSEVIKNAEKDPRAKQALDDCGELASRAVNDLRRSFDRLGDFDISLLDDMLMDLQIWLSGAISYQETCLDGFEGVKGDSGEKMRRLLNTSMEMTSNSLAMVTGITDFLTSLDISGFTSQRLLSDIEISILGHGDEQPDLISEDGAKQRRKLLDFDLPVVGHPDEIPDWISDDGAKRKLLDFELPVVGHGDDLFDWMDKDGAKRRKLLDFDLPVVGHGDELLDLIGEDGMKQRRKLFDFELPVVGHGDDFPEWFQDDIGRHRLLQLKPNEIKPDLVVAKDGSGKFKTINEALKAIPTNKNTTFVLYIKEGVYNEKVNFYSNLTHLMVIGDGPTKTRITGKLNFADGTGTYHTATVAVQGDYFIAKDIGFENTAGAEKHQAVALRVGADMSIFYNCHMDGYQDTLYVHTYRQFYRDCVISGTIDFIFGDSAVVFQNCILVVRKPMDNQKNIVTAQGRKDIRQPTGIVLQNCSIVADPALHPVRNERKSYLARPWKEYSRTIIMESFIDDLIQPDGFLPWNGTYGLETLFYTEFNNRGPGSPKQKRVKWPGIKELTTDRILRFTPAYFIEGNKYVPPTGVPFASELIFPAPNEVGVAASPETPEEFIVIRQKGKTGKDSNSARPDLVHETATLAPHLATSGNYAGARISSDKVQPGAAASPSPAFAPLSSEAPSPSQQLPSAPPQSQSFLQMLFKG